MAEINEPKGQNYNPLDEAVNEKPYSRPNVAASIEDLTRPINEPFFIPPPIEPRQQQQPTQPQQPQQKRPEPTPINPSMNELPNKEKHMAAKNMAIICLDGYSMIHVLANKGLQFNEKKLARMHLSGVIDLNAPIPYDLGKTMPAGDFIKSFNAENENALVVTNEFREKVMPVLTRVLEKHSATVSDEGLLGIFFGQDMIIKGFQFASMKRSMGDIINQMKEQADIMRGAANANAAASGGGGYSYEAQPQQPTPPPPFGGGNGVSSEFNTNVNDQMQFQEPEEMTNQPSHASQMADEIMKDTNNKVQIIDKGNKRKRA